MKTLEKVYDIKKYLNIAQGFPYIPKINEMGEQIEKKYDTFKERGGEMTGRDTTIG